MKALRLSLWLIGFVMSGIAIGHASEPYHSATVDMPDTITMTYASHDTWQKLPPPTKQNEQGRLPGTHSFSGSLSKG
jgi:hypothetical protein